MAKMVQVPFELLLDVQEAFDTIDPAAFPPRLRGQIRAIQEAIHNKLVRMELRDAYSRMVDAHWSGDEDDKLLARIAYLIKKRERDGG